MGLLKSFYQLEQGFNDKVFEYLGTKHELKSVKSKLSKLQRVKVLSKTQKTEAIKFYKQFLNKNIPLYWHQLYYSINGSFDPCYLPESIYFPILERRLNKDYAKKFFSNKLNQYLFLKSFNFVKLPKIALLCLNGILMNPNFGVLDINGALNVLREHREMIFSKPLSDYSGHGCELFAPNEFNVDLLNRLIKVHKGNFILEAQAKNHESISKLHPESLNTLRIITYRLNGNIYSCPVVLRVGRHKNHLDNANAGGVFVGVNDDGTLLDRAYSTSGEVFAAHPDTNICFRNHKIPGVEKAVESVCRLHRLIPSLTFIHWDVAVDFDGEPLIIEFNSNGGSIWLPQIAHGKGPFGDNAEQVLSLIK